jgi:glycosyltransferase involved in cell wall biosynthesis
MSNHRTPRVSIGLPVFNGAAHISKAVGSLLSQDFADFELIISDNASTDGTPDLCAAMARADKRIRFERQSRNLGANRNFSWVLAQARSDLFMWVAHDDLRSPSFVGRCVMALEEMPEAVLAIPDFLWVNAESGAATPYVWSEEIANPDPIKRFRSIARLGGWMAIYGLIRRRALTATRSMENLPPMPSPGVGVDYLVIELAMLGPFARIAEPLLEYNMTAPASTQDLASRMNPDTKFQGTWFWWWVRDIWRLSGRHFGIRTRLGMEAEVIASLRAPGSLHHELRRYNRESTRLAIRDRKWAWYGRLLAERWLLGGA